MKDTAYRIETGEHFSLTEHDTIYRATADAEHIGGGAVLLEGKTEEGVRRTFEVDAEEIIYKWDGGAE